MVQDHVSRFVQQSLDLELRYGIDRNLSETGITLDVAVRRLEINQLNVEVEQCSLCIPLRQTRRRKFFTDCLRDTEPCGLISERGVAVFVAGFVVVVFWFVASLASDRHAESQRSFAALDVAAQCLPSGLSVYWTRSDRSQLQLRKCQDLISNGIGPKCVVSLHNQTGPRDCVDE